MTEGIIVLTTVAALFYRFFSLPPYPFPKACGAPEGFEIRGLKYTEDNHLRLLHRASHFAPSLPIEPTLLVKAINIKMLFVTVGISSTALSRYRSSTDQSLRREAHWCLGGGR